MQVGSVTCGRGGMPPEQQQQQQQHHQKEKKGLERRSVAMCRSGRNIPSADGWCRKRRKKEGRKKEKNGERIPGHLACRRFCTCTSCRRSIPTPKEEKKRNVCRVNFDLFRFSHTLQLVITCRTELPTTPIMLWWLLLPASHQGYTCVEGKWKESARSLTSHLVANAIRFLHRILLGTFSGANRVPAQKEHTHTHYIEASFPQLEMMTRC